MGKALVIIDIQNDYFPGGAMELVGSDAAAHRAKDLIEAFRERGLPVIHIQHLSPRPGATFFIPDTPGVEIHPLVLPKEGELVMKKYFSNSFRDTSLLYQLGEMNITQLTFAGMMTHLCIDTTVRAAYDRGFRCKVAADACATRDLVLNGETIPADQVQKSFLAALDGFFAKVFSTEEIIKEL